MRPRTGLQDVFVELDPGTKGSRRVRRGRHDPDRQHRSRRSTSTRSSRRSTPTPRPTCGLLFVGAGQGLKGRARDLGEVLGGLGPINRQLARAQQPGRASARQNLANLVHNFNVLTGEIGDNGDDAGARWSTPPTPRWARSPAGPERAAGGLAAAGHAGDRARPRSARSTASRELLGPTFNNLRPFARNLDELNASVRRVADTDAGDPRRDPAVRARRARAGPRPAPGARRASPRRPRG